MIECFKVAFFSFNTILILNYDKIVTILLINLFVANIAIKIEIYIVILLIHVSLIKYS